MREVLGDRATFVEVGDIEGLLEAGASATRPAPAPPQWTWADTARATWATYAAAMRPAGGQNAPRPQITAGSVLARIVRSRKTDQRSR